MKERPILMNAEMVRSVLSGRKTQTRRAVKPQPERSELGGFVYSDRKGGRWMTGLGISEAETRRNFVFRCPYGQPGDRLWVRETWADTLGEPHEAVYRADGERHPSSNLRWRPSIHMPRWASRITLEITGVRVERVQDISVSDALAEGISRMPTSSLIDERTGFAALWMTLYGDSAWSANPWVWVVEFKRTYGDNSR